MINDGGAERMVKHRKITWWQILAIIIMAFMVFLFAALVYLFNNGEVLVGLLNKATVGEGTQLLKEVKEEFPYLAVYAYEQKNDKLYIEFRYYQEIEDTDINYVEYSNRVKNYFVKYLNEHEDCYINTKKLKVDLYFPDVHYSNYNLISSADFEYNTNLSFATYDYSGISASQFINDFKYVDSVKAFFIKENDEVLDFSGEIEYNNLLQVEEIYLYCADAAKYDVFIKGCTDAGVTVKITNK